MAQRRTAQMQLLACSTTTWRSIPRSRYPFACMLTTAVAKIKTKPWWLTLHGVSSPVSARKSSSISCGLVIRDASSMQGSVCWSKNIAKLMSILLISWLQLLTTQLVWINLRDSAGNGVPGTCTSSPTSELWRTLLTSSGSCSLLKSLALSTCHSLTPWRRGTSRSCQVILLYSVPPICRPSSSLLACLLIEPNIYMSRYALTATRKVEISPAQHLLASAQLLHHWRLNCSQHHKLIYKISPFYCFLPFLAYLILPISTPAYESTLNSHVYPSKQVHATY